jgi:hypothetical protein
METKTNDSHRWEADIYYGWVPWRWARWWSANKMFYLIFGALWIIFAYLLTGVIGFLIALVIFSVGSIGKFWRDRKRGIGFTKKREVVIFGPHKPLAIPVKAIQAIGVMKINRFLAMNLQREDAEIAPDQKSLSRRIFGFAGFKSNAPIRAKNVAAAREMSMGSGKGLIVVVRDHEGVFWNVSTASGYEVAALRDLAALASIKFITPGNPFGKTVSSSKKKTKNHFNKARIDTLPDNEVLRKYGIHQLNSLARLQAFIKGNTIMHGDQLPEEWIAREGLHTPTQEEVQQGHKKVRVLVASLAVAATVLLVFVPLLGMRAWPATTSGLLTSSWPRPYERLWATPQGWNNVEKFESFAVFQRGENETMEAEVVVDQANEIACESVLIENAVAFATEEELSSAPPEIVITGDWKSFTLGDSSLWCQQQEGMLLVVVVQGVEGNPYDDVIQIQTKLNV